MKESSEVKVQRANNSLLLSLGHVPILSFLDELHQNWCTLTSLYQHSAPALRRLFPFASSIPPLVKINPLIKRNQEHSTEPTFSRSSGKHCHNSAIYQQHWKTTKPFKTDQNIFKIYQTLQLPWDTDPDSEGNYNCPLFLGEFSTHGPLNSFRGDN